jgi:hypothetical protein
VPLVIHYKYLESEFLESENPKGGTDNLGDLGLYGGSYLKDLNEIGCEDVD